MVNENLDEWFRLLRLRTVWKLIDALPSHDVSRSQDGWAPSFWRSIGNQYRRNLAWPDHLRRSGANTVRSVASAFPLVTSPVRALLMIASSDESTMAAMEAALGKETRGWEPGRWRMNPSGSEGSG
jgi:hypothetical protein